MKVYIATHGSYSDKHVVGVYSTKAGAKAAARLGDDGCVTEWAVNDTQLIERGAQPWAVDFDDDGNVKGTWVDKWTASKSLHNEVSDHGLDDFTVYCLARDEDHAIKIASDIRARHIANAGVTRP